MINLPGSPIHNKHFYDFTSLIEKLLTDTIDIYCRKALETCNIIGTDIVLLGGKASNYYISLKDIKKSFDFDIHILGNVDNNKLNIFGNTLETKINNEFINLINRQVLYSILLHNKLVTDQEMDYYMNTANNLFVFGNRYKNNGLKIYGMFLILKLRDDLFMRNNVNTNIDNSISDNNIFTPYLSNENIIYYPIMDIAFDKNLNMGIELTKQMTYKSDIDKLYYPKLPFVLYNLIKYLTERDIYIEKADKLINRIKKLSGLVYVRSGNDYVLNNYDINNIDYDCKKTNYLFKNNYVVYRPPLVLDIKVSNTSFLPRGTYVADNLNIYKLLVDHIFTTPIIDNKTNDCNNNIILGINNPNNPDNIVIGNNPVIYAQLERATINTDTNGLLSIYTSPYNNDINKTLILENIGLNTIALGIHNPLHNVNTLKDFTLSDNTPVTVQLITPINFVTYMQNLDRVFNDLRATYDPIQINQHFYVYRLLTCMSVNSPNGDNFNLSTMSINDIFYNPSYVSTSFSQNYSFKNFVTPSSFIFKIRITKNNKSWGFVNKLSFYPNECEIVLNRGVYFRVINIHYKTIRNLDDKIRDILVVEVELYDNYVDLQPFIVRPILNTTQIGGTDDVLDKYRNINLYNCPKYVVDKIIADKNYDIVTVHNVVDLNVLYPELLKNFNLDNMHYIYNNLHKLVNDKNYKINIGDSKHKIKIASKINIDDSKDKINIDDSKDTNVPGDVNKQKLYEDSIQFGDTVLSAKYETKYLKYKNKYLKLKQELDL